MMGWGDFMKKQFFIISFLLVLTAMMVFLSGCEESYSKDDIENAKQQAYSEGYNDGYSRGSADQKEKDYEELLMDGASIWSIRNRVYDEFGITPREAFNIYDSYNYDPDHDGITQDEYQKAIEAMLYTSCIFPQE
jgi:hypothetical protein